MPIVEVTMIEGRPAQEKAVMVERVTDVMVQTLHAPIETVRIIIREVPAWHFAVAGKLRGSPPDAGN